jgi:hypothetical protein
LEQFSITTVILSTNILMALMKKLTEINFLVKLKYKITLYEDSRIQLLILFILDASVGMKYVMQKPISEMLPLYFNMIVI